MDFINNIAKISGNLIYQDASGFRTSTTLSDKIIGINHKFVYTPPNELKFSNPAILINDSNTHYNSYFIKNNSETKSSTVCSVRHRNSHSQPGRPRRSLAAV